MKSTRLAMASLLAVGLLPAIGATTGADAKGAGGPLRDGNWAGTMTIGATISLGSGSAAVIAQGSGNGTFNLALNSGVGTGDYVLRGSSSATLEGNGTSGNANAAIGITGSMGGTGAGPILQPVQGHADVSGSVSVSGFETPFNESLDFGPDDILASTLKITSSSCTYASGTWAQEIKNAIQAAGVSVSAFQGSWAAVYKGGATPDAADAALVDILSRGEAIVSMFAASGTFDTDALEDVLADAELYAASAPKNEACSRTPDEWSSPLAGLIERLLSVMSYSKSTTATDIMLGINVGVRTGVLPSTGDDPLEGEVKAKTAELLAQAIANGAEWDIVAIQIEADFLHWTDLSQQAIAALGGGK